MYQSDYVNALRYFKLNPPEVTQFKLEHPYIWCIYASKDNWITSTILSLYSSQETAEESYDQMFIDYPDIYFDLVKIDVFDLTNDQIELIDKYAY